MALQVSSILRILISMHFCSYLRCSISSNSIIIVNYCVKIFQQLKLKKKLINLNIVYQLLWYYFAIIAMFFQVNLFLTLPRVNFINVLRLAFRPSKSKYAKKDSHHSLFTLLGRTRVKAMRKMLVKLTPKWLNSNLFQKLSIIYCTLSHRYKFTSKLRRDPKNQRRCSRIRIV